MNYTQINGLNISKLTLGIVQLGMEYGIANKSGKPDMEKALEILQTAINKGINSFDTANAYGNSEEVSSLVLGVETPDQIFENAKLIEAPFISPETRDELSRSFKSIPILKIMEGLK